VPPGCYKKNKKKTQAIQKNHKKTPSTIGTGPGGCALKKNGNKKIIREGKKIEREINEKNRDGGGGGRRVKKKTTDSNTRRTQTNKRDHTQSHTKHNTKTYTTTVKKQTIRPTQQKTS
jgi:hypothetical protein